MKYLRNNKHIKINGARDKTNLINLGYYHAYKGCRFYNNKSYPFNLTDFYQIEAIYNFDKQLKALIYPNIMFIETALKNHTLQNIVEHGKSDKFSELFESCFNGHMDYINNTEQHNRILKLRADVKAKIYGDLAKNFNNRIIGHFYKKDAQVPIWALFEILTLGDFNKLYECLNKSIRLKISKELKLNKSLDSDAKTMALFIFALKNLRNSIAHNNFIYDNRFNDQKIAFRITKYFYIELNIPDMDFNSIVDYIILIAYLLKQFKCYKSEIKKFIKSFTDICNTFYNDINSISIYNKIIPTNSNNKLKLFLQNI